jgi:PKD repeat protein
MSTSADVCSGDEYVLRHKRQPGYKYLWRSEPTGFISSDTVTFLKPIANAVYILKATSLITGCSRSDSVKITVVPSPHINLQGDATVCGSDDKIYMANNQPGITYEWESIGGNIISGQGTHQVTIHWGSTGAGHVKVRVTNAKGCSDSSGISVSIFSPPEAAFSSHDACVNSTVEFVDSTVNGQTQEWDFGDGETATGKVVHHAYAKAGTYNVTLAATTINGCTGTLIKTITIHPAPKLDIAIKPNGERTFTFGVSDISYPKYQWDFGDGSQSSRPLDKHVFSKDGEYPVSLSVTSNRGCVLRVDTLLKIETPPKQDSVVIFPNPARDKVTVRVYLSKNAAVRIGITDELGKTLASDIVNEQATAGIHDYEVDDAMAQLAPALYIFIVNVNDETITRKVIKLAR